MKAGRELDALVEEAVLGLCAHRWKTTKQSTEWNGDWTRECEKCGEVRDGADCDLGPLDGPRRPRSTKIAAAWDVVEKMGRDLELFWNHHTKSWQARIETGQARADTAPHAICLAALRALGVEVGE